MINYYIWIDKRSTVYFCIYIQYSVTPRSPVSTNSYFPACPFWDATMKQHSYLWPLYCIFSLDIPEMYKQPLSWPPKATKHTHTQTQLHVRTASLSGIPNESDAKRDRMKPSFPPWHNFSGLEGNDEKSFSAVWWRLCADSGRSALVCSFMPVSGAWIVSVLLHHFKGHRSFLWFVYV